MNSLGLKRVTFYLIRHKATGQIMPLAKRGKGYSWWNPGNSSSRIPVFLEVPRLIETVKKANKIISEWNANPNGRRHFSQNNYTGEYDDIIDGKPDGRKKEDLEIIKIRVIKT